MLARSLGGVSVEQDSYQLVPPSALSPRLLGYVNSGLCAAVSDGKLVTITCTMSDSVLKSGTAYFSLYGESHTSGT